MRHVPFLQPHPQILHLTVRLVGGEPGTHGQTDCPQSFDRASSSTYDYETRSNSSAEADEALRGC